MIPIDFSTLPDIKTRLEEREITMLNGLFQNPTIQDKLTEIEIHRKTRAKWKWGVYVLTLVVAGVFSFILGKGNIITGFFYTIGSGDNSFSPTIWATVITYILAKGALYTRFASKIEIPLKTEVLAHMCPLLYSKLEYSYDARYSFDELDSLRSKQFLSSYDSVDRVEDSVHFNMENDGKMFSVNGFELETSEMRRSGKNSRRVTTNHAFLLKAVFPNARIPLTSDLFIYTDKVDSGGAGISGLFFTLVLSIAFSAVVISFVGPKFFWIGILGGIVAGIGIYKYTKKSNNKNRVQLENVEFEKLFDVKCEDQVTSRMIITPAFMDRIVSFVQKTGNRYEFIFQSNVMYVKRHIVGNYLEAGTEKNMLTNLQGFVQFYTDMREIIQFIYDMNLMYLSKTDTSKKLEQYSADIVVKPILLENSSVSKKGFFSGFSFFQKNLLQGLSLSK